MKLNEWIYKEGTITHFFELGDQKVFPNAMPNCVIFRFCKGNFSRITNDGLQFLCKKGILYFLNQIVFCMLTIIIYFKEKEGDFKSQKSLKLLKEQVKGSLKELKDNPKLKILLVGHLITPIFFMSHFQMWQAYFLKQGVKEQYLFMFYIAFQVISILIHFLKAKNYSQKIALSSLVVLLSVSPLLLSNIPYCFIGVYALMVAFFTYMSYCLGYQFSKFVSKNNISSLSSLLSSCVRVISVLVLSLSSLELRYFSPLTIITMHFALTLIMLFFFLYKAKPFDE